MVPPVRFFFQWLLLCRNFFGNYLALPPLKIIMVRSLKVSESVAWFFKSFVVIWEQYLGNIEFCLHYTTEHTLKLRHERVGQTGPRDVLFATISLQQSVWEIHQVTSCMRQSQTRKPQKSQVRKNRDLVPPAQCVGSTIGVLRLIYKQQNEKTNHMTLIKR